jgi:hypothetical protein
MGVLAGGLLSLHPPARPPGTDVLDGSLGHRLAPCRPPLGLTPWPISRGYPEYPRVP